MVVEARVLVLEPGDEPDVEMDVAVELDVHALLGIEADELVPERALLADRHGELDELVRLEVAIGRDLLRDPGGRAVGHPKSSIGFSARITSATASPNDPTVRKAERGSRTGASLPKTNCRVPNVARQSSSARGP